MNTSKPHTSINNKIACTYGEKCYRKNPDHFNKYSHPIS